MNDWEVLGLAPVRDTAAIKKAYAVKLRTTRPDDDAPAYQRLREAYDAAMAYAKGAPHTAPPRTQWEDAMAQPPAPQAAAEPAAAPQPQWRDAAAKPVETINVDELVAAARDLWEKHGDATLLGWWPQLKNVLHASALTQAQACSTAFAQMVLDQPQLPAQFVDHLRHFFGWGADYKRAPELAVDDAIRFKLRLVSVAEQLSEREAKLGERAAQQAEDAAQQSARQAGQRAEQRSKRAAQQAAHQAELAAQQRRQKALKEEQERIDAATEAALEADRLKYEAFVMRGRFGHLLPFARMMAGAPPRTGVAYATLIGSVLQQQWSALTEEQRDILEIGGTAFDRGLETCKQAMRLRAIWLALVLSLMAIRAPAGSLALSLPLLACLWLCHRFPIYQWQENLRWRLYPRAFLEKWISLRILDHRLSRKTCVVFGAMGLVLCLAIAPTLTGHGYRYSACQAVGAVMLLACQWLFPPDGWDSNSKVLLPVLLFCMAALHAAGVTDVLTLVSLSAFWFAVTYASLAKVSAWVVGMLWMVVVVFVHFYWLGLGRAPTIVPLSFIAPWLVFMLARRESAGFVIAAIAMGALYRPSADPAMLGFWVGVAAVAAGFAAVLMRNKAAAMASDFT